MLTAPQDTMYSLLFIMLPFHFVYSDDEDGVDGVDDGTVGDISSICKSNELNVFYNMSWINVCIRANAWANIWHLNGDYSLT